LRHVRIADELRRRRAGDYVAGGNQTSSATIFNIERDTGFEPATFSLGNSVDDQ
jgi:hypothetical protein